MYVFVLFLRRCTNIGSLNKFNGIQLLTRISWILVDLSLIYSFVVFNTQLSWVWEKFMYVVLQHVFFSLRRKETEMNGPSQRVNAELNAQCHTVPYPCGGSFRCKTTHFSRTEMKMTDTAANISRKVKENHSIRNPNPARGLRFRLDLKIVPEWSGTNIRKCHHSTAQIAPRTVRAIYQMNCDDPIGENLPVVNVTHSFKTHQRMFDC